MSTTHSDYQTIELKSPTRVLEGRGKATSIEAVNGITITRVIDGQLDTFHVAGPSVVPGVEIPASNIAACVRKQRKPELKGIKGEESHPSVKGTKGHE